MSDSSIVPERQLVFSPGLAATIGLEEAILLQHLHALFEHRAPQLRDNHAWLSVPREYLLASLPFWSATDLQRISRSLVDKGVILVDSPPLHAGERLVFALNEPLRPQAQAHAHTQTHNLEHSQGHSQAPTQPRTPHSAAAPEPAPTRRSASHLPANWSPSEDLLKYLSLNHNIPLQFALDQLEDFIFYWRERGETSHAWENKFRQHVTSAWQREQQSGGGGFEVLEPAPLNRDWRPSEDALEIMERGGIAREFIEDAIPEFILYWRERGTPPKELNTKFIQHVRLQWARYTASVNHGTEARPIPSHWRPSPDVFDILRMSHIDLDFARELLPEFIVYWKDSGQVHTSWNSKFLQHVKYHWAKRHQLQRTDDDHGGQQGSNPAGRTRDRSLQDDLSDTSWAN
ncbi:hypothetical protein E4634_01630 [Mangrovimicrobium sediminis]|uniref:DnaT DNA-binding domain-containing protein n=1 Tax=Mangrovimicrobium sediminis TaxID=2562682 RepID=A0A4Z0M8A4_9GAMM|nr:DnaT-like ssDNA-binding domain-containing protein [Haliea sp. SAOS-164]TGD75617.1 hypothetical protein E4634_01630 [Haliea sp. SAOS-164]